MNEAANLLAETSKGNAPNGHDESEHKGEAYQWMDKS